MTKTEKLIRDIETLRESIQIDYAELAATPLTDEERAEVRIHLAACVGELKTLLDDLWATDDGDIS